MTIPRLLQMSDYWGNHPPTHEILLAIGKGFGMESKQSPNATAIEDSNGAFLRDFMAAGGTVPAELLGG